MKNILLLFLLVPVFTHSQDNCKVLPIEKHVVLAKKGEPVVKKDKDHIQIRLVGDFDDSCWITVNRQLIFRHYVSSNFLLGSSGYSIALNKMYKKNGAFLKVFPYNKNVCFTEKVDYNYPVLEIRFYDNKWILTYTNKIAHLE